MNLLITGCRKAPRVAPGIYCSVKLSIRDSILYTIKRTVLCHFHSFVSGESKVHSKSLVCASARPFCVGVRVLEANTSEK